MKILAGILILVASTGVQALAMEHYTNHATDQYGQVIGGAQVSVYLAGTSTLATIYSDNGSTTKANPFLTSVTSGVVDFYAANGAYDLVLSAAGKVFTANDTRRITLFDYANLAVSAFPANPFTGMLVVVTDDTSTGDCASDGGTQISICVWDGSAWGAFAGGGGGGVTGWPTVSTTKEVTWANSFANAMKLGDGTGYWAIGRDATDGLFLDPVCGGVRNDCNFSRALTSGKYWEIKNSSATSIFRVTNDTGAITNATLDPEGVGNNIIKVFTWDLDLCAISPADGSTSHVWNKDPLSTAPTLTARSGTNRGICVASFPDSDGAYGVQISRAIPDGTFTGTFDAHIWWDTTGTGNARFQVQTKCYADDEADDASFNTASVVTAAAGTSGRPNLVTLSGITTTGCAAGETMRVRFFRDRTEASDTLNSSLNVERVVLKGRVIE